MSTRRICAIIGGFFLMIIASIAISSAAANAATEPKPVDLIQVGQKFIDTVHRGGDLTTAANTARDEAVTIFTPQANKAIATVKGEPAPAATAPAMNKIPTVEQVIQNALPDSIPNMVREWADDHIANPILSITNGTPTKLPPPTEQVAKTAPLLEQGLATVDLFVNKPLHADARGCGSSARIDEIQCAMHIVNQNTPAGDAKLPNSILIARFGVNVHSIDSKGRICGGYIAVTNYCNGQMQLSTIAVDSLAGNKKASVAQWVFVEGHEGRHHIQNVYVTKKTGNPLAFRDMTEGVAGAAEKAENNADEGGGYVLESAVSNGDLTRADLESALVAVRNSGNKGVEGDTHATPEQRVANVVRGGQYFLNGKSVPEYELYDLAA